MIVMETVGTDELFTSLPAQEVDFKWSSGSKLNKRIRFLTQQAAMLVKLWNQRVLHFLILLNT